MVGVWDSFPKGPWIETALRFVFAHRVQRGYLKTSWVVDCKRFVGMAKVATFRLRLRGAGDLGLPDGCLVGDCGSFREQNVGRIDARLCEGKLNAEYVDP